MEAVSMTRFLKSRYDACVLKQGMAMTLCHLAEQRKKLKNRNLKYEITKSNLTFADNTA